MMKTAKQSEIDLKILMMDPEKWIAWGNTFPHRDKLLSAGWSYDRPNREWYNASIAGRKDPNLLAAQGLNGVNVMKVS